ncbi:MAG: UDP-N-acetylmuramate dehydrogenase [Actinobacteria bacterium]|nr:UDP-N-acetylmuramate dehydrogenase [Actinomycetota bacterium]
MIDEVVSLLNGINLKVERDVPMLRYTTWKVGGPADLLVWVDNAGGFMEMLEITREFELPFFILGNGSNVLIADEGVRGAAVRLKGELAGINIDENTIKAGGGALLSSVVTEAYKKSLGGLEFTFGIPGTVGGAVMTNAGAFNKSISNVLSLVRTIDSDGTVKNYDKFKNNYRSPLVPREETVISSWYLLQNRNNESIRKRMDEFREKRRQSQPWGMPTAGSVFKNPEGDHAGRLIEECGLKGRTSGSAKISEIHGNFIINEGGATAGDIKSLIDMVIEEVASKSGVKLQPEVQFIGF